MNYKEYLTKVCHTLVGSVGGHKVGEVGEGVVPAVLPLRGPPAPHPDPGRGADLGQSQTVYVQFTKEN